MISRFAAEATGIRRPQAGGTVRSALIATLLCAACQSATRHARAHSIQFERPSAMIGHDTAVFAFPAELDTVWHWNTADSELPSGRVAYAWEVYWWSTPDQLGRDPHAIWCVVRQRAAGPRQGTLAELVNSATLELMTADLESGTSASFGRVDSALSVSVVANRIIFRITGPEAVTRIFPVRPDSVLFLRMKPREAWSDWAPVQAKSE